MSAPNTTHGLRGMSCVLSSPWAASAETQDMCYTFLYAFLCLY